MKTLKITALFSLIITGPLLAMEGVPPTFCLEEDEFFPGLTPPQSPRFLSSPEPQSIQYKVLPPLIDVITQEVTIPSGKIEDGRAWLDLNTNETFTTSTFKENIEEAQQEGLPYTIAVVTTYPNDKKTYMIYDAQMLNTSLFGSFFANNRYAALPGQFNDTTNKQIIIGSISYFAIDGIDGQFEYLGGDHDVFSGSMNKKTYMTYFFDATEIDPKDKKQRSNIQRQLAIQYLFGTGTKKNISLAFKYLLLSAKDNNAESMVSLGKLYGLEGIDKDYAKAKYYFEKAAEQNNPTAYCSLGILYLNGLGVDKDYSKAEEYFKKAAEKNDPIANYKLGFLYLNGLGVYKDYSKAEEYFKKVIDANADMDGVAQSSLDLVRKKRFLGDGKEEEEPAPKKPRSEE